MEYIECGGLNTKFKTIMLSEEASIGDHILYDSTDIKYPEKANL